MDVAGRRYVLDCYGHRISNKTHMHCNVSTRKTSPKVSCMGSVARADWEHGCRQEDGLGECTTPDLKLRSFPGRRAKDLCCHTQNKIEAQG